MKNPKKEKYTNERAMGCMRDLREHKSRMCLLPSLSRPKLYIFKYFFASLRIEREESRKRVGKNAKKRRARDVSDIWERETVRDWILPLSYNCQKCRDDCKMLIPQDGKFNEKSSPAFWPSWASIRTNESLNTTTIIYAPIRGKIILH